MSKNQDSNFIRTAVLGLFLSLFLSISSWAQSYSLGLTCSNVLISTGNITSNKFVQISPLTAKRDLKKLKRLRLMSFNVENLIWHVGKFERTVQGLIEVFDNKNGPQQKPEEKIEEIRKIIQEESPDVIVLVEVESLQALQHLADKRLEGKYQAFLIPGNDARGINIGYLVKTDLPIYVQHITNKDVTFKDPVNNFKEAKIFSRDLPILTLRTSLASDPFMIVVGNHAKSQRDRPGDPSSVIMRTIQYQMAAQIVLNYHQVYPNAVLLMAGDFNADGNTAKELDPIRNVMPSGFDILGLPFEEQITQTYHPRGGPTEFSRLDDVRIIKGFENRFHSIRVIPYKDQNGNARPPAQTYSERSTQPSDHRPVLAEILLSVH